MNRLLFSVCQCSNFVLAGEHLSAIFFGFICFIYPQHLTRFHNELLNFAWPVQSPVFVMSRQVRYDILSLILPLSFFFLIFFWCFDFLFFLFLYVTTYIEECSRGTGQAVEAASVLPCHQLPLAFLTRWRADGLWHLDTHNNWV